MRAVFLLLLLWAVACAHPVPGHEPTHPSAQQEDTANEAYNKLGNLVDGEDGRHPPAGPETGENALSRDLMDGNAVDEELGEHSGRDKGGQVGQSQHVNQVDHKDAGAYNGNDLGFLEEDARDADDGDNGEHYGTGVNGFPSHGGGFLDEEDDSGDDTFDANGEEERGEGPTYVAGADGAGEHDQDAGRGDAGAGGGHGDSSSSSSSESIGADHRHYRNYRFERTYRHGGASSSSQEESYDFEDEAMQGDDPSVFDSLGSSYKVRYAGPRSLGNSRESARGAGSHRWGEGDSRSPEVEDADSGEDSPSVEDNSQSEEPLDSQSEEESSSHSREDGDGEDSPSREDEDSRSRESTDEQSDEEPGESPEVVRTLNEHSSSRTWEGQEDWESAEDRSVLSAPDSESGEEEGDQSKSREDDDDDQTQSTEDTVEESKEDGNDSDSVPSTSAESQSTSPEDDSSPEDNTGEDSRSTESDNSESQEDDEDVESHSQEDASHESSSHGDDSSLQSLESGSRKRRLGALRHKPAADYDDNDCQDGY